MTTYIVTDKLFPFDRDGGTAYTSFEWAQFLSQNSEDFCVIYHGQKEIDHSKINFTVKKINSIRKAIMFSLPISKRDIFFLNSAFKIWEIFYFLIGIKSRPTFFWSGHGSFDVALLTGLKKFFYTKIWAKILSLVVKNYICNSSGELNKLPPWLKKKAIVIENLFPIETIGFEVGVLDDLPRKKTTEYYFLIFGRIDAKKNIAETILKLQEIGFFKKNILKIAGPCSSPDYLKKINSIVRELGIEHRCQIFPEHFGDGEKISLLRNTSAVLLFSKSEGLPIVILESLMLGVPVFCSKECNVDHLDELINIINLNDLRLESLESIDKHQASIESYDIGRGKLNSFIRNGYLV